MTPAQFQARVKKGTVPAATLLLGPEAYERRRIKDALVAKVAPTKKIKSFRGKRIDATGKVVAALNVAGPTMRFTEAEIDKYAPKIIQLANRISEALGYVSSPIQSYERRK